VKAQLNRAAAAAVIKSGTRKNFIDVVSFFSEYATIAVRLLRPSTDSAQLTLT
jgi:hypothetical protein